MRREIIVLQEKNDEDMNAITYTDLLQTGAEALSSDADEDEVGGVELGRGTLRARISYTPGVAEVEERIDNAMFRGRQWNVTSKERDHFRMTLGLERV